MYIGATLKRLRAGRSQEAIARELGVSLKTVGRWERNRNELTDHRKLKKLAQVLGVDSVDDLRDVTHDAPTEASGRLPYSELAAIIARMPAAAAAELSAYADATEGDPDQRRLVLERAAQLTSAPKRVSSKP